MADLVEEEVRAQPPAPASPCMFTELVATNHWFGQCSLRFISGKTKTVHISTRIGGLTLRTRTDLSPYPQSLATCLENRALAALRSV